MRRSLIFFLLLTLLLSSLAVPLERVSASTYRSWVAQVPASPTSQQSVRVWMNSDTGYGETAVVEYNIGSSYIRVLGFYDTSYPGANWFADIPAQPNGTSVRYQLFTRNQYGNDYGFTGFNWSYTVNDGDIRWNGLKHDSFDPYYRSPFGAVPAGTPVMLRFRTFPLDVDGVSVRVYTYDPASDSTSGPVDYPMAYLEDRVEGGPNYAIWAVTLAAPISPAVLYYKFRITDQLDVDWYSDSYADDHDNLNQGGLGAPSDNEPFASFQISVYDPAFTTPDWLKNAVVYQIFPDRFRNGDPSNDYCVGSASQCPTFYGDQTVVAHTIWNEAIYDPRVAGPYFNTYGTQFYGGDLKGIQQKLDYLQGLGVNTLYLTPIFSARSNHRYDTENYLEIDPALGTLDDFKSLVADMDRRGMHLILDGVFNHTSSDSLYFDRYHRYESDGGCESLTSPYRNWYEFNNTNVPCGAGDYTGWFGYDSLAVLTDNSAAVRDFIYRSGGENVIKFWYGQGASGWRFDVADEITHNWWRDFRPYAKNNNANGPLVGEVWYDASRYLLGDQLDSVMNYRFRKNVLGFARGTAQWNDNDNNGTNNLVPLSPSQFDSALKAVREDYPPQAAQAMLNLLDSHDTNRALYVLTLLGENSLAEAKQRLQLSALFQFTYLGAPTVYYGDEAGLNSPSLANGSNGPEDDPYNRAPYPWADAAGDPNVYGPADESLIAYYSQLAHLRYQHQALRTGDFTTLLTGDTTASSNDNGTYAFARSGGGETAVVVLNNRVAQNTASVPVAAYYADGATLQDALSSATYSVSGGAVNVTVPARGGLVLFPAPSSADVTPPSAAINPSPAMNANGWANSPVTVALSGTDSGSGVKELRAWVDNGLVTVTPGSSASQTLSSDGVYQLQLFTVDNALNFSALVSSTIRIDQVPPTLTQNGQTPTGWNKTAVTLHWNCADDRSGPVAAGGIVTISGEGASQPGTMSCADLAGNITSKIETVKIDLTPPQVTVTGVANGATYTAGSVPAAGCSTTDALSGVETQAAVSVTGGNSDGTGVFTTTCSGSLDKAGNSAAPVSVSYTVEPVQVFLPFIGR